MSVLIAAALTDDCHSLPAQVRRLRVADASVMPRPPSGNTHATCVMIGERAAQFMIDDARGKTEV